MPERISDELLFAAPITHDEYAAALKELVEERARAIRRRKADAKQDAALAILAEENAKADAALAAAIAKSDAADALLAAKEASSTLGALPPGAWPPWSGNNFGGTGEPHPADSFHSDAALARQIEQSKPAAKPKAKKEK